MIKAYLIATSLCIYSRSDDAPATVVSGPLRFILVMTRGDSISVADACIRHPSAYGFSGIAIWNNMLQASIFWPQQFLNV